MNLILFFMSLNIFTGYYKSYHHPEYNDLHDVLSRQLKEETRDNFITLNNARYSHRITKEYLSNQSVFREYALKEKKMKVTRKIDSLFAKYQEMIRRIHVKSEKNLNQLERIRAFTSDKLSSLKAEHLEMIEQLNENDKKINELMKDKKETHGEEMLEKYNVWKKNHEEAEEIINGL
jgi:hypothetical protein